MRSVIVSSMESSANYGAVVAFLGIAFRASLCALLMVSVADSSAVAREAAGEGTGVHGQAYIDYLAAISLAEEGSKPEALRLLAESLRLQSEKNPAAGLVFQLLTEQRTNSSLLLRGHAGGVLYASYSPDGTKIVTGSEDHTARIWDAHTGLELLPPLPQADDVLEAVYSPDGKHVATGCEDGTARIWDAMTGQPIGTVMKETDAIKSVRFSPDGKLLATGSDSNYARIWDAATGKLLFTVPRYHDTVFSVNFSPDGSRFLTATGDGRADVFDTATGKLLVTIRHHNNIVSAVFSPDGKRILTGSSDETAAIWDAKTGKPLGPVFQHGYWIFSALFNADATRVVTASWDHTARVWNAKTGKPVTPPLQHGDAVYGAVFSPDGLLVATASRDHTARLWDASTGEPMSLPLTAGDEVTSVAFNPAGTSLLYTSKDNLVRFVDLPPRDAPPEWIADLADFAATQVRYDATRKPKLDEIMKLRTRLLASTSNDPWQKFGRWYFSESDVRPISPWSTLSLQDYVNNLIALGDKDSIQYAMSLAQDHPAWMVKLVPIWNKLNAAASAPSSPAPQADK
jgi:WD40 repeat protein